MSADTAAKTTTSLPAVIAQLGELPPEAIITIDYLSTMFGGKHHTSIRRAIDRGELPPYVRLFGKPTWTIRVLTEWTERRLAKAELEAQKEPAAGEPPSTVHAESEDDSGDDDVDADQDDSESGRILNLHSP